MNVFRYLSFFIFMILSGCKVGPDYAPPCVSLPEVYNENEPEKTEEIEDENLNHWWTTFNDPFLDYLIDLALAQNYDYKIALERVYQARFLYWVQFTQILPELDAVSYASRSRESQGFPIQEIGTRSPLRNFFQGQFDIIWEFDLFGKFRRSADASYDLWEATADEMRGIKIEIISEVTTTYATICSYQKKQDIAIQTIALDEELFALSQARFEAGLTNEQETGGFLVSLEADKAQLTLVQAALKQSIYSLGVLLGTLPETIYDEFKIERPIPHAEGKIPVAIPSELLRRRPDIQSAERQLAAATEQIGIAVADLFPSVVLSGSSSSFVSNPLQGANMGFASNRLSELFLPSSMLAGIGGLVVLPLFDFGKRVSTIDAQTSLRNQAYYSYQQSVIAALQETEESLEIYFNEEKRNKNLEREIEANGKILSLTADLFQSGLTNYTQVLESKKAWLASLYTFTDSQQNLVSDLIAIYKALGGDWQ